MNKLSCNIGKTPLVQISERIWAKYEGGNPSGSIKDRMAAYIINDAENKGLIKKGDTIIEATSGNSGIAFAFLGAERGYKVKIVMPCNMSNERKQILKYYGAELIEVSDGDFDAAIQIRNEMSEKYGYFNPNQFHNPLNAEVHSRTTAMEILNQHPNKIGAFVAGTGTGGTLMGTSNTLKQWEPTMLIVAVEPAESPVMSGGQKGIHGIQGIGDGSKFLVDLTKVDEIILIKTEEAKERAKRLSKENGLFVGISSGANVLGCEILLEKNKNITGNIITVLSDRGDKYLSCY
jgi:cysteine synthase A